MRIQILKAACAVPFDEQPYRGKDGGILGSSGSASCRAPVPEADFDAVQYVQLFGKDAQPQGQHSGHAAQGEAHDHTSYLSVSAFGDKMPDGIGHCRADFRPDGVQGFDLRQLLQKIMPRMTVMFGSKQLDTIGHGSGIGKTMQAGEHGRVHRQPHETHFLSASGFQTVLGQLVGKPQFAAGEKEQTPVLGTANSAFTVRAAFALSVGQHVGAFGKNTSVDLPHFIQNQHIVVVQGGDAFKPVARSPPASDMLRTAPDGGGDLQCRGLTGG